MWYIWLPLKSCSWNILCIKKSLFFRWLIGSCASIWVSGLDPHRNSKGKKKPNLWNTWFWQIFLSPESAICSAAMVCSSFFRVLGPAGCTGPCWQQIAADPSTDTVLGFVALWLAGHRLFSTLGLSPVYPFDLLKYFFKTASITAPQRPANRKFWTF